MPFKNACFVSYRHGQFRLMKRIIDDLEEALCAEIEPLLGDCGVFIDRNRLSGGDKYNEILSAELCYSVCMIVVYTPTYFERSHTFCAREFKAMSQIEKHRLELLAPDERRHGLIIPIVFRGFDDLPVFIRQNTMCCAFKEYDLGCRRIGVHPKYRREINKIAKYIYERRKAFESANIDPCTLCEEFDLPDERDILNWLGTIQHPDAGYPR